MSQSPIRSNGFPQARKLDFIHYIRLLFEKKVWIILITILVSIAWYFMYPIFLDKERQYYFWAIIRFDDPRLSPSASGVDDQFMRIETESKTRVIKTTPFLTKVVDSLKLNILSQTRGLSRENIFSDVKLDKRNLKYGKYIFHQNNNGIEILYTNEHEGKKDYLINTLKPGLDSTFNLNAQGISAKIYMDIFNYSEDIEFTCTPTRYILENLRANLNLNLNRQQTLLTIAYHYKDPILGSKVTNTIAGLFLEQTLEFKRSRTTTALQALEEQLQSSREQLELVEEELKNFRERNPNIYLTENLADYNRTLISNENERNHIQNNLDRLNQLIGEKNNITAFSDRILVYKEILTFLEDQNIAGLTALNQQYDALIAQRTELVEQNFSDENLRMSEINRNLHNMHQTIDDRTIQYLNMQSAHLDQIVNNIQKFERSMRQSPRKELQLAKLQRDRDSKSQVYSSVLLRYNEIKTSHASITPDAFLLESAQLPVVHSNIMDRITKLAKLMIGPFLGFAFALGLFIGIDFIWHRARSVEDMEGLLKLPVMATIPLLKSDDNLETMVEAGKRMDPLLVTIDYTPSLGGDAFRNLRTRLILDKDKEAQHQLVITSLMPNEGKSHVASNLAITFAQLKKQTLLIDADMRRGVIHNNFLCSKKPGLADLLGRGNDVKQEHIGQVIQKTTIPNLYLMTSGSSMPNPTELLIGDKIENMILLLQKQFHYIIIDTPPIELIPDAFVINKFIKNLLLVTRYGETNLNQLKKKLNEYSEMTQSVKGVVLNASIGMLKKKYQAYSYYKY